VLCPTRGDWFDKGETARLTNAQGQVADAAFFLGEEGTLFQIMLQFFAIPWYYGESDIIP